MLSRIFSFYSEVKKLKNEHGYVFAVSFMSRTIYAKTIRISVLPFAIFIACLRPWIKVRFISLSCMTIGHYSLSVEVLLCKMDQDKHLHRREKIIFLQRPKSEVCNEQLHKMWQRTIFIAPDILYHFFTHIELYLEHWFGVHAYKTMLGQASHDRWDVLETSKQHLFFTKEELLRGEQILNNMGIPKDAKYICLLVRDNAYYATESTYNKMSGFKNADVSNYKKATFFLADQGFYVIRMGKKVNKDFSVSHKNVIDYARSHFRSDFMDIYLSAHCYFFMSTLCGLDGIPHAFRRPILASNITPHGYYDLGYPVKLFLLKKIINKNTGKFLSFKQQYEIFKFRCPHDFFHQLMEQYSLEIIENSEEEILATTKEMLLHMQDHWRDTELTSALQEKFWLQMPKDKQHRYADGAIISLPASQYRARYCTADLINNNVLLEDEFAILSELKQNHVIRDQITQ